ncbi:hypothetical protein AWB75_02221 [Caballeronia catudaia]|uniref:Uncharacterized protein n=1 Tax=Caballeronia catudaia TaxID=1777136 RepID=A0A158AI09_9BURK|nr:hypothetical protein AWB75_02221 [Caballeronia catudaia]
MYHRSLRDNENGLQLMLVALLQVDSGERRNCKAAKWLGG